jgi:Small subunit of serine palmitoyltransferase-like
LKKYQYEVTFSLYMLTPTERLIFSTSTSTSPFVPSSTVSGLLIDPTTDFIILLLLILLVTAASMYLPNHVALIYNRIWYYVHGNNDTETTVLRGMKESLGLDLGSSRTAAAERVLRTAVGEL